MAKDYIQSMLGENERIVLSTRQHWFVLFSAILAEITVTLLLVAAVSVAAIYFPLAAIGFVLLFLPLISMLRDILIWTNHEYLVTNRRVIQISGIFNKNVVDSSLEKVNDVKMTQSFFGRMFDYVFVQRRTRLRLRVAAHGRAGTAPRRARIRRGTAASALPIDRQRVLPARRDRPGFH